MGKDLLPRDQMKIGKPKSEEAKSPAKRKCKIR